jgi:glycerate dehydrogenase
MSTTARGNTKPIALFLNCTRLDYDRKLDFDGLANITDFRRNDVDTVSANLSQGSGDQDAATIDDEIVRLVNEVHSGTEILILKEMPLPKAAVERFSDSVKLICEAGTGYNNIPIEVCRSKYIDVCNIPTYSTEAVAQTAITYVMNFAMNLLEQQAMLQRDDRSNFTGALTLPLMELNGKTLGLVGGAGRIGTRVAEIALVLGMKIVISSRSPELPGSHKLAGTPNVRVTSNVDELLRDSDFVSLHTPLNAATEGSFGRAQISKMKKTAYLINTSRGKVCNEDELIECLREGIIAGAGLDVTATEPPSEDSELWNLPNVWLSPHIGWRRLETRQRLVDMTVDNVRAYIDAEVINKVN